MLFTSMKEAQEVLVTIFDRKDFPDLTQNQMSCIKGLYIALDVLDNYEENHCGEAGELSGKLGEMIDEISCSAVSKAEEDIMAVISELVACFRDENACE